MSHGISEFVREEEEGAPEDLWALQDALVRPYLEDLACAVLRRQREVRPLEKEICRTVARSLQEYRP